MRAFSLLSLVAFSLAGGPILAEAGYQPFQFECVYDASTDGLITATSKLVPDNDDWTFLLKSNLRSETESFEAVSAVVMGKDETIPEASAKIIDRFASQLKINKKKWFTTTEVVLFDDGFKMSFFKFNSKDGTLGIGVYSLVAGQEYFTDCK